tara:strand:- start:9333 stop:10637 length:1305 start_codon:yes stop_codon:yes gene_type:complete
MMTDSLQKLLNTFSETQVKTTKEYFEKYGGDWYKAITPDPTAIIFPESESDLKKILKIANEDKQAVVISGGRTGLCGGATAANKEIVISLERMNSIEWIEEKQCVKCGAGAITDLVKNFVAEKNRLLPISLASSSSSSIGGNVATNAAGSKFIRYGATKDHVTKMRVMLANGEVLSLQKEIAKDATGPNLMELFFGSEGSLGIIFEVVLKTEERLHYAENILIKTDNLDQLRKDVLSSEIRKLISSIEYWDKNCQTLLGDTPTSEYSVIIELVSNEQNELDKALESLATINESVSLLNSKQAEEIWAKREDLPVILADNHAYKMDLSIPMEKLQLFLSRVKDIDANSMHSFGHLGDGNIHVNIISKTNEEELISQVYNLLKEVNGSPSAEHGIGQRKKEIWTEFSEYRDKYKLLETLKKSMDPNNILCPKVFFK